jgi:hypothetical protein
LTDFYMEKSCNLTLRISSLTCNKIISKTEILKNITTMTFYKQPISITK